MAVWNFENAAHLLRRAAFGGTTEQIQDFLASHTSVADAVADLVSYSGSKKRPPKGGRDSYKAKIKQKQWWLKTMLKAKNPRDALREKVVLFLHGHLCSGFNKQVDYGYVGNMAIQNGLFRLHSAGNFRELVREFNRDPANLIYLDGWGNYASNDGVHVAANENFGREVLELFTLGVAQMAADGSIDASKPNYSEDDVHQLARALTGWTGEFFKDKGVFDQETWDGGQYDDNGDDLPDDITIFGVTNNNFRIGVEVAGTTDDVLELIFSRNDDEGNPQAAMYVCRKLWKFFGYPPPAPGYKALIAGFADIFRDNDYALIPVLTAMFNHDEFYSDAAKTRTVKNPVDYMVGMFRTFGLKSTGKTLGEDDDLLVDMLDEMGMELYEPPNVAGWPGGARWITTGTLVNRLDFARRIAEAESKQSALHLETVVPIGSATADPDVVLDAMIRRVGLDGSHAATYQGGVALTSTQRDALRFFLTDQGTKTTLDLSTDVTDDAVELVRGTIALVLQSAEAQIF